VDIEVLCTTKEGIAIGNFKESRNEVEKLKNKVAKKKVGF